MEKIDYYNENMEYMGTENRDIVHQNGWWHKTVHCWLYDKNGNIYFQIRRDKNKYYTTASGHLSAGETVKEAFGRETKEETNLTVDYDKAIKLNITLWSMDSEKNGVLIKDRAFANVYLLEYNEDASDFTENEEVSGLALVNAKDCLELFKENKKTIEATIIKEGKREKKIVGIEDFLINKMETGLSKYEDILVKVINLTKNSK